MNKLLSGALRNLDTVSASTGLVIMLAALVALRCKAFHPIYIVAITVGIACVLLYLVMRPQSDAKDDMDTQADERISHFWGYIVGAAALLLVDVAIYVLRADPNTKPLWFYILAALAVSSLFLAALHTCNRTRFVIAVAVACSIGLTHIWTESLLFPASLLGLDPWTHMDTTARILDTKRAFGVKLEITTIGGAFSLMHLYLRTVMDTIGIGYKMASLAFFGSLQMVGNVVLAGLVGKKLFGYKVGAIAATALAIANWNLFFAEWVIPNAIGATLSMLAAYFILPKETTNQVAGWLRMAVVMVIIVIACLTHIIAAAWVIGTTLCLYLPRIAAATRNIRNYGSTSNKRKLVANLAVIVAVALSLPAWLTFTTIGNAVALTSGQFEFNPSFGLTYAIGSAPVIIPPEFSATDNPHAKVEVTAEEQLSQDILGELTLDSIGMFLYIGLALFGALAMLGRRRNIYSRLWAILGVVVLAIGFFPPLFGKSLLEPRWWYFSMVLLAIPLGVALVSMAQRKSLRVPLCVVVCAIAFLSTIGLPSNLTNRTLSPNLIVRYALTENEMQGIAVAESLRPEVIGADPLYCNAVLANKQYSGVVISIERSLITGDFSGIEADMLLIRDAVYKEPFGFGGGTIYKLDPRILDAAAYYGYEEVWSNGEVHILEKRQ